MAGKRISKGIVLGIFLCAIAVVVSGCESQGVVMDAYKLRMQGKVDEAKALLEQAIAENPDNADAHYELARTQYHMALGGLNEDGGLGELDNMMGNAQQSIQKAVESNPEDVRYHLFAGYIACIRGYFQVYAQGDEYAAREHVVKACEAFESAVRLKPHLHEAMLYLVEMYGVFSESAGGNKSTVEQYAKQLEGMDDVFGAKARSILMPEDVDRVDYWQEVLKNHEGNIDVLEELGKAYLGADKVDDAVSYFEEAVRIDPEKAYLFLDLSIYHTFSGMRAGDDSELFHKAATSGDAAVTRYIESEPILPMLAYALGVKYRYKSHSGDKEQAQALLDRAEAMDPYFSKATGSPNPDLFIPPGEISRNHRYLLRPF